jgi:hypothetical protein
MPEFTTPDGGYSDFGGGISVITPQHMVLINNIPYVEARFNVSVSVEAALQLALLWQSACRITDVQLIDNITGTDLVNNGTFASGPSFWSFSAEDPMVSLGTLYVASNLVGGTAAAGGSFMFAAPTVFGRSPFTYQWRKNGTNIAGATGSSLSLSNVSSTDVGSYSVVVSNSYGIFTSNSATLSVVLASGTHSAEGGYVAGDMITINNTISYTGTLAELRWQVLLPTAWSLAADGTSGAQVVPMIGATDLAEWTWTTVPMSPISFTYRLSVPSNATGAQSISALVLPRVAGVQTQILVQPEPLIMYRRHAADSNRDGRVSLIELTRVIELYNTRNGTTRTGCYKPQTGSEDGFAEEPTRSGGTLPAIASYHSADSNRDGRINLLELTRLIEFYNYRSGTTRTGQYRAQANTEDGFASGP